MLCRSTPCHAHHQRARHQHIGQGARPACGGEVGNGAASAAARNLLRHSSNKIGARRPGTGRRRPAHPPPRCTESALADGGGLGGGCGRRQSRMSGERHAVCARHVGVRRPEGVWRGVAAPRGARTRGTNITKSLLKAGTARRARAEYLPFIATDAAGKWNVKD